MSFARPVERLFFKSGKPNYANRELAERSHFAVRPGFVETHALNAGQQVDRKGWAAEAKTGGRLSIRSLEVARELGARQPIFVSGHSWRRSLGVGPSG